MHTLNPKQRACGAGRGEAEALAWLPPENDFGNVEYKLRLKQPLPGLRFQQLVTQLNYRLSEGAGECFYCVGAALNTGPFLTHRELEEMCASASGKALRCYSQ